MSGLLRALASSLAMTLVMGACGSDDGVDSAPPEVEVVPAPPVETQTEGPAMGVDQLFCDKVVEAEEAVSAAQKGGDRMFVDNLLVQLEDMAPQDLSAQVNVVVKAARAALFKNDTTLFQTQKFARRSGKVSISLSNLGHEYHEMMLFRVLDQDAPLEKILKSSEEEASSKSRFVRRMSGPPGTEGSEPMTLRPGRYAIACFIPVGASDNEGLQNTDGPRHVERGMFAEFTVG